MMCGIHLANIVHEKTLFFVPSSFVQKTELKDRMKIGAGMLI